MKMKYHNKEMVVFVDRAIDEAQRQGKLRRLALVTIRDDLEDAANRINKILAMDMNSDGLGRSGQGE